ncbi:MAG: hypothetical protein Q7R73_04145 [bacterium]|nr:hypothetical protein [bacterium]
MEDVEGTPRKTPRSIIPVSSTDFIDMSDVDFSRPKELLKFKLANSPLSDAEWIRRAAVVGIANTWNREFQVWMKRQVAEGKCPQPSGGAKKPGMFREVHFGPVGKAGAGSDWKAFTAYMLASDWPLESLGKFGEWAVEANLDPRYAKAVIKEFLED